MLLAAVTLQLGVQEPSPCLLMSSAEQSFKTATALSRAGAHALAKLARL